MDTPSPARAELLDNEVLVPVCSVKHCTSALLVDRKIQIEIKCVPIILCLLPAAAAAPAPAAGTSTRGSSTEDPR